MQIREARKIAEAQYAATHTRLSGNPDYERLRASAEAEAEGGGLSHFARNQFAFYLEVHTPMVSTNG